MPKKKPNCHICPGSHSGQLRDPFYWHGWILGPAWISYRLLNFKRLLRFQGINNGGRKILPKMPLSLPNKDDTARWCLSNCLNTAATRDYVGSILPGQTVNNCSPGADMTTSWTVMYELARVVGKQLKILRGEKYMYGITISHNVTALYFLAKCFVCTDSIW